MILHYCSFSVRPPVNFNWWTNLPSDWDEKFCCCIATAAQIALSQNGDLTRFSLKHRNKADMSANITAGYRATGFYPINPSVITDTKFSPSLLTHWGHSGKQNCQRLECQLLFFFHNRRIGRLLICLVYLATLFKLTWRHAPFCNMDEVMSRVSLLQWRLQIKKYFFVFCVRGNLALFYI